MCLNGWGGKMHDVLLPYLMDQAPDVLCLQEVVHAPTAPKPELTFREGDFNLPQRARFLQEVSAALPDHIATFSPATKGDLWDGKTRYASQWGLATFVHKSLPIISQFQGFVHKCFEPDGYGDHPRSRSAHAVRVYDFAKGYPVTIAHMHGLRDLAGKHDTPERVAQAKRLRDMVLAVAEPADRLVVCGDFNVLPESKTFTVLRQIGLTDLVTSRGFESTRNSQYKKPGRFADYMLVNDMLLGSEFHVIHDPEVSDHCPLILEIG